MFVKIDTWAGVAILVAAALVAAAVIAPEATGQTIDGIVQWIAEVLP